MLAYLDPIIKVLFFGGSLPGVNGSAVTRTTATFNVNFTNGPIVFTRGGGTSLVSVATIVVFVVAVIGLLLTIAGSFATGAGIPPGAGPTPAASTSDDTLRKKIPPVQAEPPKKIVIRDSLRRLTDVLREAGGRRREEGDNSRGQFLR